MNLHDALQVGLFIGTLSSTWLLSGTTARGRRAGFIFAASIQPVWFAAGYIADQLGVMALAVFFVITHIRGALNNRT